MTLKDILNELLDLSLHLTRIYGEIGEAISEEEQNRNKYLKFVKCEKADTAEPQKRSIKNGR